MLSRTHVQFLGTQAIASGPVTANVLYEIAAGQATIACSGASASIGPRTAGGKLNDYVTPLECRFTGEVTHAASRMDPKAVNEIVKQIVPKYETVLKTPDIGKPYQQAYDVATGLPTAEWEGIYNRVRSEVKDLGIPLD